MSSIVSKLMPNSTHSFFTKKAGINKNDIGKIQIEGFNNISASSTESFAIMASYFQVKVDDLVFLNQTHSNNCIIFNRDLNVTENNQGPLIFDGDAIISNIAGKVLCVTTADCAPILLLDRHEKISGAIHSGWRGALNNVLEATVDSFEKLGSKRQNIIAVLGPTISRDVYEVKDDFLFLFERRSPSYSTFFNKEKIITFDLPGFLLSKLKNMGLKNVDFLEDCTFKNSERFFSHRRATLKGKIEPKRQVSAIKV